MNRPCKSCAQDHGPLYICPSYSDELKAKIKAESDAYIANLSDPSWCQQQIDSGVPPEVIAVQRWFAGLA